MNTNTTNAAVALPNLTVKKLKTWARQNKALAMTVCKAKAFAEVERERVDAYVAPIFARYGFKDEDGNAIATARQLYLCEDDAACAAFYAELDVAHVANGWKGEVGHCPALVAEDLLVKAENVLLASLEDLVGVESFSRTLETRAKALEIALGSCLGALS